MDVTSTPVRKRLSRGDRRAQMLDIAQAIIEQEGADALTLALVAERSGVSKPVAYDHFETRTNLLVALLKDSDRHYEGVARARLAAAPETVEAIAQIIAEAYVACALAAGPAAVALAAAVEANGNTQDAGRASRNRHAEQFIDAFAPTLPSTGQQAHLIFVGLVAAANALCAELTGGRIEKAAAIETLTHLLTTSITPLTR